MTSNISRIHSEINIPAVVEKLELPSDESSIPSIKSIDPGTNTTHSLADRVKPIHTKQLLKILLEQVRQNPIHSQELAHALKEQMSAFPESANDFHEVIELLEADLQQLDIQLEAIDKKDNELLDDWVYVEKTGEQINRPPGYSKPWTSYAAAAGGAAWCLTKTSGSVLYFICDKVVLSGNVLKAAAAAGSLVSVVNLVGSPAVPVLRTVLLFVIRRVISW